MSLFPSVFVNKITFTSSLPTVRPASIISEILPYQRDTYSAYSNKNLLHKNSSFQININHHLVTSKSCIFEPIPLKKQQPPFEPSYLTPKLVPKRNLYSGKSKLNVELKNAAEAAEKLNTALFREMLRVRTRAKELKL
ncbi:Hypothetical_protein [Hexamita inflata]|uniref:Hypothetical_protein n=1 Tax=Hexamita inflata TaxID=28002 RepID=A0ABP1HK72_9EUKA